MKKNFYIANIFLFFVLLGSLIYLHYQNKSEAIAENYNLDEQSATVMAIKKIIPSVVSIIVQEEEDFIAILPDGAKEVQKHYGETRRGTGFIISADGYIVTNKHVIEVQDIAKSSYKVVLNSKKEYYAQFIGKDPINDLAILKIFDKNLPAVELGNSDKLDLGMTVVAVGNALGRYQNSVTKGIISGLDRNLAKTTRAESFSELVNVIQTDAEINIGNSGGPLVDLSGKVVGINVAIDNAGKSIGFAIPINDALPVIKSVKEFGIIKRSMLGVKYIPVDDNVQKEMKLKRNYGALIHSGEEDDAIIKGGPAELAGLMVGDIIFEINAIEIKGKNNLLSVVQKFKPGDKIGLKIQRGDKVLVKVAQLGVFK